MEKRPAQKIFRIGIPRRAGCISTHNESEKKAYPPLSVKRSIISSLTSDGRQIQTSRVSIKKRKTDHQIYPGAYV